nr:hypothetical protein [uncultured Pedobacter sp.]
MAKKIAVVETTATQNTVKTVEQIAPEQNLGIEINAHQTETTQVIKGPFIVIPFLASKSIGDELKYALRSWALNCPDAIIVLVGDKPDFCSEEVLHIPHTPESDNPQIDVAHKLLAVIASDLVPEKFYLSNDDIYALSKILPHDLDLITANGMLKEEPEATARLYQKNRNRTIAKLKEASLPLFNYATHTPIAYEKTFLGEVIADTGATEDGMLLSSLYFNAKYPDVRPLMVDCGANGPVSVSVFRANPDPAILKKAVATRKFLNHNDAGYPAVLHYLEKLFSEKSKFEK